MLKKIIHSKIRGFTLIELLVVIAIVGLLASVVMVSLNNARKKARDAKRLADMKQLQTALDVYYDQNNDTYPNPDPNLNGMCGGWDTSSYDPFITALKTAGVMSKVPVDPLNTGTTGCGIYAYRYYRYPAGYAGCDSSRGWYYVLGINSFESSPAPVASPGWSCPSRDWGGEFQWVTGKFER